MTDDDRGRRGAARDCVGQGSRGSIRFKESKGGRELRSRSGIEGFKRLSRENLMEW